MSQYRISSYFLMENNMPGVFEIVDADKVEVVENTVTFYKQDETVASFNLMNVYFVKNETVAEEPEVVQSEGE